MCSLTDVANGPSFPRETIKGATYLSVEEIRHEEIEGPKTGATKATRDEAFIREAVQKAGINALRIALYQVTSDPELAIMKVNKEKIRGGALFDYRISEEDEIIVKEKAVRYLMKGKQNVPPAPGIGESHKLMNMFGGVMIGEKDILPGYEELAFEEFPREVNFCKPPLSQKITAHKVVIIGAGLGGIATAIQLKRLGIPYTVIERQGDLGGTWLLNNYPECRVDTLSYLYQYKFEKNYKWPEYFASAQETLKYLRHICDKHGVSKDFQYNREVVEANWDESSSTWRMRIINKEKGRDELMTANSIISASGLFSTPNVPDIPGIQDYEGKMFHTTQWDYSVDFTGMRVAVIGTGSTGTQLIPGLAPHVKSLAVYQRTPNWIASYEGYGDMVEDHMSWLCDNMPFYWNWYCYAAYFRSLDLAPLQVRDSEYEANGGSVNERNDVMRKVLTDSIRKRMSDRPDLIDKLIPKYAPLVRRLVVDNGFYDVLKQDNCELVTDKIERFTKKGIVTADGVEREFDLVVLSAGFKVSKYFSPCEYVGRGGVTLEESWKKDGARSYLGMAMPGFPNLFTIYGPNHQPRGGSLYSWAEIWARYAVASVVHMIENDKKSMEVRPEVYDEYQAQLDEATSKLIWESDGAGYYVNEFGRQGVNMPWTTSEYHSMVIKPNVEDFVVT